MSEHSFAFSFTVEELPSDSFVVHSFTGKEGLSELYHFDILLVAPNNSVSYGQMLQKSCCLTMQGKDHTLTFNGIVSSLKIKQFESGKVLYQAVIVPQLYNLTLQQYSQIFLNKSFQDILKSVLHANNISNYEFKLQGKYPVLEYVCQFNESYYNFLSRWMEHYGIYYYFEQGQNNEKVVFTDASIAHVPFKTSDLQYHPASGLETVVRESVIKNFYAEYSSVPRDVLLKDYSYQYPSVEMEGHATVGAHGVGTHYTYGDNFKTPDEAAPLAKIRAQEFQCREMRMAGESLCPGMLSGYTFSLQDHFYQELNGKYLLTSVRHTARNWTAATSPGAHRQESQKQDPVYSNTFACIPASQQYRPPRLTQKPRYFGLLSATIDSASSGRYAELDSHGRYKVIMPFDLSGRSGGKASCAIRLAQPYAGGNYGMHFPLHKGTEVLVSFVEGDVDRPLITGAVHNFDKPNHVVTVNQDINAIVSATGHQLAIGDTAGNGYIHMQTASHRAGVALLETGGTDNPDTGKEETEADTGKFLTYNNEYYKGTFGQTTELTLGSSTEIGIGVKNELFGGGKGDICGGMSWGLTIGAALEYFKGNKVAAGDEEFACAEEGSKLVEKEYKILVAPPEPYPALISTLKTSIAAVAAVSLASAALTVGEMALEFKGEEAPKDGYKSAASIIGDADSCCDLVFDAAVMVAVNSAKSGIAKIVETAETGVSAEFTKADGIEMITRGTICPNAKIKLENSWGPTAATISLSRGQTVEITAGTTTAPESEIKLNAGFSTLDMKVNNTSLVVGEGTCGQLQLKNTSAVLGVGPSANPTSGIALHDEQGVSIIAGSGASKAIVSPDQAGMEAAEIVLSAKAKFTVSLGTTTISATAASMSVNSDMVRLG